MKTRRVMVSGLKDVLRTSSSNLLVLGLRTNVQQVTKYQKYPKKDVRPGRVSGSDVREIFTKLRDYPQKRWGWCVSHVVCI